MYVCLYVCVYMFWKWPRLVYERSVAWKLDRGERQLASRGVHEVQLQAVVRPAAFVLSAKAAHHR